MEAIDCPVYEDVFLCALMWLTHTFWPNVSMYLTERQMVLTQNDLHFSVCWIGYIFLCILNLLFQTFQVALFCACMGGIMYYLEYEPDTMAPFLRGLIRRFLASRISNPNPPTSRSASYTYLQTLDAMNKPKLEESKQAESSSLEKLNLESISGL